MIETLNNVKSPSYSILQALLVCSNGFFFGFGVGLFNTFGKYYIETVFNITDKQEIDDIKQGLNFLFVLGGFCGCFLSAPIYEKLGRYKALILFQVLNIVFVLFQLSHSLFIVQIFRFLSGFNGVTWTILGPLFVKETVPPKYGKFMENIFYIFLTGAILLAYSFSGQFAITYWYFIMMIPVFFDVPKLLLNLFVFRQESPETIFQQYKNESEEVQREHLARNFEYQYESEVSQSLAQKFLAEKSNSEQVEKTWRIVLQPDNQLQFILVLLLNFMNQATGINFLVLYSSDVLESMGLKNVNIVTMILGIMNILGGVLASLITSKFGTKKILVYGMLIQAVAHIIFLFGYCYQMVTIVIIGSNLYMLSFAVSLGASLYPYQSAILDSAGIGLGSLPQWLMAILISKFGLVLMKNIDLFYIFYGCMLFSLLGAYLLQKFGVDIQDKTQEEIKREFIQRRKI